MSKFALNMGRIEKTVFISYRRTNAPWALAISQSLTNHGYDVFFDFTGIKSGDFESVILGNIEARKHFVVLLTPSALKRCGEPGDWLRQEIETALKLKRNIVPLMLEGFTFRTRSIAKQLTGSLAVLKNYNALSVPVEYFDAAMTKLRECLNVALDAVVHPATAVAQEAARVEQAAVDVAPPVTQEELTAQEWFERGFNATNPEEQVRCYSEALRRQADFAEAFYNRGISLKKKGDLDRAIADYAEAIRLKPDHVSAFYNRANARKAKGELDGAIADYNEAIRLKPDHAWAFNNRGNARKDKGDLDAAIEDYDETIRLEPNDADVRFNRAEIWEQKNNPVKAIADYQKYLDLGGGERDGDTKEVEQRIRELKKKL